MEFLKVLEQYKLDGWLMNQTHPDLPLTIWNYTQSTQFERKWDEVTIQCRGLVTDDKGNVVARPFKKFFNIEEGEHTPTKDFSVYEKMDGSLGIAFNYNDEWIFASRGSFTSDQCLRGIEILNDRLNDMAAQPLIKGVTYMFEIIYPENRIVVDYDGLEDVVMLGANLTDTGNELAYEFLSENHGQFWSIVKQYDNIDDYGKLKEIIDDNQEGFVIHFENGDRCKIKGEEYVRLHRIMTNASTTSIWDVLKNGDSMEEYLKEVPDEFYGKIHEVVDELEDAFWEVANKVNSIFKSIYKEGMDARTFSSEVMYLNRTYQGLLWNQFNLKMNTYSDAIWNYIKPDYRKI